MHHIMQLMVRKRSVRIKIIIDILEGNSKFIIYSTKLKEVDSPAISRGYTLTSSIDNIT